MIDASYGPLDSVSRRKQVFSQNLVESKRLGRTLPAVINGVTASVAAANGMIVEELSKKAIPQQQSGSYSLFITDHSDDDEPAKETKLNRTKSKAPPEVPPKANPFTSAFDTSSKSSAFGAPTNLTPATNSFSLPSTSSTPLTNLFENGTNTSLAEHTSGASSPSTSPLTSVSTSSPFGVKANPFQSNTSTFNFFQPSSANASATNLPLPPETGLTTSFGSPSPFSGKLNLPTEEQTATSGNIEVKNSTSTSLGPIISSYSKQTQNSNPFITTEPLQQAQVQSPFSFNPTTTTTVDQPPPNLPTPAIPDKIAFSNPLSSSDLPPSADKHITSTSPILSQSMQFGPFTTSTLPPSNNIQPMTTPSTASQLLQPPQVTKPANKPPSPPSRSTKSTEPSRFLSQSSNTKPKISSPLSKPAITPPSPPEIDQPSKEDGRSQVLDGLAKAVMIGPNGLLEQFIEHTVDSMISAALKQVEDEKSWKQASQYLLSFRLYKSSKLTRSRRGS